MGLLDDIEKEPKRQTGRKCAVQLVMSTLDKADCKDLETALADLLIPATTITRVLERRQIELSASAINRHRRRECVCD